MIHQFLLSWGWCSPYRLEVTPARWWPCIRTAKGHCSALTSMRVTLCLSRWWQQVDSRDLHLKLRKEKEGSTPEAEPRDLLSLRLLICWAPAPTPVNLIPDPIPASNTIGFRDSEFLPLTYWLFYQGSCSPWCGAFSVLAISARRFSILSQRKPSPCPHK